MCAKKFRIRIPPPATLSLQSLQNRLLAVVVQAVRRGTGFEGVQAWEVWTVFRPLVFNYSYQEKAPQSTGRMESPIWVESEGDRHGPLGWLNSWTKYAIVSKSCGFAFRRWQGSLSRQRYPGSKISGFLPKWNISKYWLIIACSFNQQTLLLISVNEAF